MVTGLWVAAILGCCWVGGGAEGARGVRGVGTIGVWN
jgi:hypothetical protein